MERISVFMNPLVSTTVIDVPAKFAQLLDPSKLQLKIENFIVTQTSGISNFSIILNIEELGNANQSNQEGDYSNELGYINYKKPITTLPYASVSSDYTRTNALGFSCPDMAFTNNRRLKFSLASNPPVNLVYDWTTEPGQVPIPEIYGGVSFDAVFYLMKD
jgi:hypothetical protein